MKRIHDSLNKVLENHRIVFWYDPEKEWRDEYDAFACDNVEKILVENNEFGVKVRIRRSSDPRTRFLLYFPSPRPADSDNWLIDLLLQGHEYKADKVSLALLESGLNYDHHPLVEKHITFFNSHKRVEALKSLFAKDDGADMIRLKMVAVLAGADAEMDNILLHFLGMTAEENWFDPVSQSLADAKLADFFWQKVSELFGYRSEAPSLKDFAVSLFRSANPLDPGAVLHQHAKVFLQRWKDGKNDCESFKRWSAILETELNISSQLAGIEDVSALADSDLFAAFDRKIMHSLCGLVEAGGGKNVIRNIISRRKSSFWYEQHKHGYLALESALDLQEDIEGAELGVEDIDSGIERYVKTWWRADMDYRHFCFHLQNYGQPMLMEKILEKIEKSYLNNFLLPLNDLWSDTVKKTGKWATAKHIPQRGFFNTHVKPFLDKNQKVVVIVSDAFRYEAAMEFASLLRKEDRWNCDVETLFGSLPSYTQLGMASLLPGGTIEIDPATGNALLDGQPTAGLQNRDAIIKKALGNRAVAFQTEDFLELNTKTDGRAIMRDNDVIFIYHNTIDATGDSPKTESKTFEAVDRTFGELLKILKKSANMNASNMILTSDHGFLFQLKDIPDEDMVEIPKNGEWLNKNRRFALGRNVSASKGVILFKAGELGLLGDWTAAFPASVGRFPLQGSSKRYVHGGISIQEIVIPVVKINKIRSSDTTKVDVDVLRPPAKITTGNISVSLYQERPVDDKELPRELKIGIYSKEGKAISETPTLRFDSQEEEPRLREKTVNLTLSRAADAFNNQTVYLRLDDNPPGTTQYVNYRTFEMKLYKHFERDFDE
jgi:uncharacterized protein (TIGR02687 family)